MDASDLTFESLRELVAGLKPATLAPRFYLARWLTAPIYFRLEREGREEIRVSPAAWELMLRVANPRPSAYASTIYGFGLEVREEERAPGDVLWAMWLDDAMRPYLPEGYLLPTGEG